MSSVKVAVRVRPFNDREKVNNSRLIIKMNGGTTSIQNPVSKFDFVDLVALRKQKNGVTSLLIIATGLMTVLKSRQRREVTAGRNHRAATTQIRKESSTIWVLRCLRTRFPASIHVSLRTDRPARARATQSLGMARTKALCHCCAKSSSKGRSALRSRVIQTASGQSLK